MLKLMLLTANIKLIKQASLAGIDRIFLDLEYINKKERQKGRDTVISSNSLEDVSRIRPFVKKGGLLVRINPLHANSKYEIDTAINNGADIIMLPMFYDAEEVKEFISIVNNRAKTCLLIETAQAMVRLDSILDVSGIDEMYIGLNDLHISLGLDFMFEPLSCGIVDYICDKIRKKGIPYGFGGMGKIGEGLLPAENILAEHYRLGSTSVILSRTFRNETKSSDGKSFDLVSEIQKIRNKEILFGTYTKEQFEKNRKKVVECVNQIVLGE